MEAGSIRRPTRKVIGHQRHDDRRAGDDDWKCGFHETMSDVNGFGSAGVGGDVAQIDQGLDDPGRELDAPNQSNLQHGIQIAAIGGLKRTVKELRIGV